MPPRLFIVGATASGKGSLAVELARRLDGEVISVDSMKVYRGMDIGTAKPDAAKRAGIPFHLFDVRAPHERVTAAEFVAEATAIERALLKRGKKPIFAGGTALYMRALTEGLFDGPPAHPALRAKLEAEAETHGPEHVHAQLQAVDPASAARLHPNDVRRVVRALEVFEATGTSITELQREWADAPRPDRQLFGLSWDRAALYARIDARVERMMEKGFLGEVRTLLAAPKPPGKEARQALGYRELIAWIESGEARPLSEVTADIQRNTRRFAKRQLTFFRHFPDLRWLDATLPVDELAGTVIAAL
jgi:tRNA dimethylallyltransferase